MKPTISITDNMDIRYERSSSVDQLQKILDLQQRNLKSHVEPEEFNTEGFLTVNHTLDMLVRMQGECPHILARSGDKLAGYALCMHPVFADDIDVLRPMFRRIEKLIPKDKPYMVMGQICIDKPYRKKGVFRGLYEYMGSVLKPDYHLIITEVDQQNVRSLNAHHSIGFKDLLVYESGGRIWHLIQWSL
ncbi:MAG: GNAT family N-acetyltransferase [Flavobacteriaceae bacterium]